jgi:DNA-binding NarL/FixJ family response regulator
MTRYEREAIERHTRDRERAAKVLTEERIAEMKADFERKLAAQYSFDQDPVWKEAHRLADEVVKQSNQLVAERCQQLGIPPQFAPDFSLSWYSRGENACSGRRAELRRVAYAEIEALAKNAKAKITLAACNVLFAYDGAMTCELYSQALNRHAGFQVVGHGTTVRTATEVAGRNKIDVALIGLTLADGRNSGLAALKQIRECQPGTKSIMLLDRSNLELVIMAFRAGARGVFDLSHDISFKRLCRCVEKVNEGQVWATGTELVQVLDALSQPAPLQIVDSQGMQLLTKREEDVVRLVAEGLTNRQIAAELNLSEHTVRNNLFRIFDKPGLSTRVELTLRAVNSSERPIVAATRLRDTDHEAQAIPMLSSPTH